MANDGDENPPAPPQDSDAQPRRHFPPPTIRPITGPAAEITRVEVERSFSGPVAPPEVLQGYNQFDRANAQRFIDDYFVQRQHDREMARRDQEIQRSVVQANRELAERGQSIALLVVLAFGILTAALAFTGHNQVATVVGGTTLVGIVVSFLGGRMRPPRSES